jgi:hypothetical protein
VLAQNEEPLPDDAEREIQRIGGDWAQLADLFHSRSWWARSDSDLELGECLPFTGCCKLNVPIRPVPYPSGKSELARCFHYVPTKSDTLHTSPNFEMYAVHRASSGEFPIAQPTSPRLSTGP